ncbi:unnamed protein product [Camellia sinensis]
MVFHTSNKTIFIFFTLFLFGSREILGMRQLEGEQWLSNKGLVIQSIKRGPVPPSGSNPCTYIPGGHGRCTLAENEVNFSGHVGRAPPAFPDVMVRFGVASKKNNS